MPVTRLEEVAPGARGGQPATGSGLPPCKPHGPQLLPCRELTPRGWGTFPELSSRGSPAPPPIENLINHVIDHYAPLAMVSFLKANFSLEIVLDLDILAY